MMNHLARVAMSLRDLRMSTDLTVVNNLLVVMLLLPGMSNVTTMLVGHLLLRLLLVARVSAHLLVARRWRQEGQLLRAMTATRCRQLALGSHLEWSALAGKVRRLRRCMTKPICRDKATINKQCFERLRARLAVTRLAITITVHGHAAGGVQVMTCEKDM